MEAYLFVWNPNHNAPSTLNKATRAIERRGSVKWWWRLIRKNLPIGSRAFMIRLGAEPKGIVGAGWTRREPIDGGVEIEFESLQDMPIIPFSELQRRPLSGFKWSIQGSGIEVPAKIAAYLEAEWKKRLNKRPDVDDELLSEELIGLEGNARRQMVLHRRREARLRKQKVADALRRNRGRLICEVPGCGFDFLQTYGVVGKGYTQVHHLRPLSDYSGPEKTRLADLAIVCANCHAMIHRGGKCRPMVGLMSANRR